MDYRKTGLARGNRHNDRGFTLLELLVVLAILTLLATIAYPQVTGYLGSARTETARAQIGALSTAIELFTLDNGGVPPAQIGLSALVERPQGLPRWRGPYLRGRDGLTDPWGQAYVYRVPGKAGPYDIFTLGRDGKPGGTGEDQDITNW